MGIMKLPRFRRRVLDMIKRKTDNACNDSVKNPKKYQNEFESFKNKMGKHSAWFMALDERRQWDLLFLWKEHKFKCKRSNLEPSLRVFIYEKKQKGKFFVSKQKLRESTLNQLIK
jgi:hypothetical protein